MNDNNPPKKRLLTLTLNVIENRDSSFGNTKELALTGSTCTCTCTCFSIGGDGGDGGGGSEDSK